MSLYRFKEKGPAYGLGHTEGELVEIDDEKGIDAFPLVPEVAPDGKGGMVNTGRMINAKKNYTPSFLIEAGVIVPADGKAQAAYKAGNHINAEADRRAGKWAAEEAASNEAKAEKLTRKSKKAKADEGGE